MLPFQNIRRWFRVALKSNSEVDATPWEAVAHVAFDSLLIAYSTRFAGSHWVVFIGRMPYFQRAPQTAA